MPGTPDEGPLAGSMLGLAAGIADAKARVEALERDRARIDGEVDRLRTYAHNLRALGLPDSWERMERGLDVLEGALGKLQSATAACDRFQESLMAAGGPLDQLKELADRKRAVQRLKVWAGAIALLVTGVLNFAYFLFHWAGELG